MARQALRMIVAIVVIGIFGHCGLAGTYYVRVQGNDENDGKTAKAAFKTILRASQALNHGDSLVIGPGQYRDSVLFAERYSADGSEMAITGDESGKVTGDPAGPVSIVSASPSTMAVSIHRFAGLRISGLTFVGPGQGLKLDNCRNAVVERCSFDGLTRGLVISNSDNSTVRSCVVVRCTIGMYFQGSAGTRVSQVTVAGSTSVGLLALTCGKGEVRNSIFAANNTSMIADNISAKSWTSDYNVISGTTGAWGEAPPVAKIHELTAATGQERHSVYVVPAFTGPDKYDLHISPEITWPGGLPGRFIGPALPEKAIISVLDRDGKPFRPQCAGAYDYPDPKATAGWVKLAAKFDGKGGPRQSAGIYKDDGTLVRTLLADAAGVSQLYWDGLDDMGQVAPAGKYVAKVLSHDVRVVDEGAFGDNGNALGAFNCDNANRVAPLSDGGFLMATYYDEGMYPVRRYSSSGQPTVATGLNEADFAALTSTADDTLYGIIRKGAATRLVKMVASGDRVKMANGAEDYVVLTADEKDCTVAGLAVNGNDAYAAITGKNVVRVIDLATGNKKADLPVPAVGDIAADPKGRIWWISGKDIVSMPTSAVLEMKIPTGLETPRYLAAGKDRLAVVDNAAAKVAVLGYDGKIIRTMGKARPVGEFVPVGTDYWRDPRGACFLNDGRLVITEGRRTRIMNADTGKISNDILSNFMDIAVIHPTKPEYVYTGLGVFRVDTKTGAWEWLAEEPQGMTEKDNEGKVKNVSYGSPSVSAVLGGRPFIAYAPGNATLRMVDVSDPVRPRQALFVKNNACGWYAYATVSFAKDGSIISARSGTEKHRLTLAVNRVPFKGLDGQNNPIFDFENIAVVGQMEDPIAIRNMGGKGSVSVDRSNDDIYLGVETTQFNKMVPAWGADATGVGKITADGKPMWFALSSGGNYMSVSAVNDGKNTFVMAGKSLGGQVDVFDADGLRLTTGNWGWPCAYMMGFVDMRYGVNGYLRTDGKVGAYLEDDCVGRFTRVRIDGAETLRKAATPIDWKPTGAAAGGIPDVAAVRAKGLEKIQVVPKVPELKVDGDWTAWVRAGVVPQIVALPVVGYKHCTMPADLWQTFNQGTAIGAIAHDGKNLYAYFVVTSDGLHFDSPNPGLMFITDSVELWIEEEQFGLAFTKDGTPNIFKYRFHDLKGTQWAANYGLPRENIWAAKLEDLSSHPLGRQLADITGVSFKNKRGYAVMGRMPFPEVKLVGGVPGRGGADILDLKGDGEIIRIGVAFGGTAAWGHSQDFKVSWPSSLMFSDPTRSAPFVMGK